MPAPDFETCYDFETAIEDATTSMLSSSVLMFDNPRATTIHETPSVHCRFLLGQNTGHLQPIYDASGSVTTVKWDSFDGVLEANIITDRGSDNNYHEHYLRHVRNKLADPHNFRPYLTYHDVIQSQMLDYTTQLDQDKNQDISNIRFSLRVCVVPTAWPTSSL